MVEPDQLSQEQLKFLLKEVWDSLSLIVRINNAFIDQMNGGNELSHTDERRFSEWRRAIAKAQEPVMRVAEGWQGGRSH